MPGVPVESITQVLVLGAGSDMLQIGKQSVNLKTENVVMQCNTINLLNLELHALP